MKKGRFTVEDVRQFLIECEFDPEGIDLEKRKNLYNVLDSLTENKLSKDDILD